MYSLCLAKGVQGGLGVPWQPLAVLPPPQAHGAAVGFCPSTSGAASPPRWCRGFCMVTGPRASSTGWQMVLGHVVASSAPTTLPSACPETPPQPLYSGNAAFEGQLEKCWEQLMRALEMLWRRVATRHPDFSWHREKQEDLPCCASSFTGTPLDT